MTKHETPPGNRCCWWRPARAPGSTMPTRHAARGGSTARTSSATSSITWCSTRATGRTSAGGRQDRPSRGRPIPLDRLLPDLAGSRQTAGFRPGRQRLAARAVDHTFGWTPGCPGNGWPQAKWRECSSEGMSDGSRDQLYLALRIAAMERYFGRARANAPHPG